MPTGMLIDEGQGYDGQASGSVQYSQNPSVANGPILRQINNGDLTKIETINHENFRHKSLDRLTNQGFDQYFNGFQTQPHSPSHSRLLYLNKLHKDPKNEAKESQVFKRLSTQAQIQSHLK